MKEQIDTPTLTPTQTNSAVGELEQIKEMANDIAKICPDLVENGCGQINCVTHLTLSLYKAGYRKQSEGEWETIPDYRSESLIAYRHICSVCKSFYKDIKPYGHKYCHECGAKMKGADT